VGFDKRQFKEPPSFPFIDSDGQEVREERRASAAVYLQKIEITELQIQEREFKRLFSDNI